MVPELLLELLTDTKPQNPKTPEYYYKKYGYRP